MASDFNPVFAFGDLTLTANPLNTETVVIGGKTYTFQSSLTNADGNVQIGANAEASLNNLIAAINLGPGAGTAYALATTRNAPAPSALKISSTVARVFAGTPGAAGNAVTTTETIATGGAWGGATMSGGSGVSATQYAESVIRNTDLTAEDIGDWRRLTPAIK